MINNNINNKNILKAYNKQILRTKQSILNNCIILRQKIYNCLIFMSLNKFKILQWLIKMICKIKFRINCSSLMIYKCQCNNNNNSNSHNNIH